MNEYSLIWGAWERWDIPGEYIRQAKCRCYHDTNYRGWNPFGFEGR